MLRADQGVVGLGARCARATPTANASFGILVGCLDQIDLTSVEFAMLMPVGISITRSCARSAPRIASEVTQLLKLVGHDWAFEQKLRAKLRYESDVSERDQRTFPRPMGQRRVRRCSSSRS